MALLSQSTITLTHTATSGDVPKPVIADHVLTQRVLSFDVGIRTLSSTVAGHTDTNALVIEYLGRDDILQGRSKAQHSLKIQTDRLCQYMTDFMYTMWPTFNRRRLNAILVEQQPAMEYNMKMRVMSYVLLSCLRMLVLQSYPGDDKPPIYYVSPKAKLHVFAKTYKPPSVQTTLTLIAHNDPWSFDVEAEKLNGITRTGDDDDDGGDGDDDCANGTDDDNDGADDKRGKSSVSRRNGATVADQRRKGGKGTIQKRRAGPRTFAPNARPLPPSSSEAQEQSRRYRENKKHAKNQTGLILQEEPLCRVWKPWYDALGAKQDDVGDTLLQAIYYLRHGRTTMTRDAFAVPSATGRKRGASATVAERPRQQSTKARPLPPTASPSSSSSTSSKMVVVDDVNEDNDASLPPPPKRSRKRKHVDSQHDAAPAPTATTHKHQQQHDAAPRNVLPPQPVAKRRKTTLPSGLGPTFSDSIAYDDAVNGGAAALHTTVESDGWIVVDTTLPRVTHTPALSEVKHSRIQPMYAEEGDAL